MALALTDSFHELVTAEKPDTEEVTLDDIKQSAAEAVSDLLNKPDTSQEFWKLAGEAPYLACERFFKDIDVVFYKEECARIARGQDRIDGYKSLGLFSFAALRTFATKIKKMDNSHPFLRREVEPIQKLYKDVPAELRAEKVEEGVQRVKQRVAATSALILLSSYSRKQIESFGIDYYEFVSSLYGDIAGLAFDRPETAQSVFDEVKNLQRWKRRELYEFPELKLLLDQEEEQTRIHKAGVNGEVFGYACTKRAIKLLEEPEIRKRFPTLAKHYAVGELSVRKAHTTLDMQANVDLEVCVTTKTLQQATYPIGAFDIQLLRSDLNGDKLSGDHPFYIAKLYRESREDGKVVVYDTEDLEGDVELTGADLKKIRERKLDLTLPENQALALAKGVTALRVAEFVMQGEPVVVLKVPSERVSGTASLKEVIKSADLTSKRDLLSILRALNVTLEVKERADRERIQSLLDRTAK